MSAADRIGESQQTAQQEDESRIICHIQEVCELFGNDGSDSSMVTRAIYLRARSLSVAQREPGRRGMRSSHRSFLNLWPPRKTSACRNMRQRSEFDSHARFYAVRPLSRTDPRGAPIPM